MIIDRFKTFATREIWDEENDKSEIGFYGMEKDFDPDDLDMMGFDEEIEVDKDYELTIEVDEVEDEEYGHVEYDLYVSDMKQI
jgi:hypothetical protein